MHLRLVNLVFFYTIRNGSIVLGESTLNLVLPRLTKESPIFFVISYSRRRVKAGIFLMYTLKKINKTQRSTPRTLFHPPPPSDIVLFLVVVVVVVIVVIVVVVLVVLVVIIALVNVSIKQRFFPT